MLLSGSIYLFVIYRLISALRAVGKRARSPDLRPNAAISLIILRAVETACEKKPVLRTQSICRRGLIVRTLGRRVSIEKLTGVRRNRMSQECRYAYKLWIFKISVRFLPRDGMLAR